MNDNNELDYLSIVLLLYIDWLSIYFFFISFFCTRTELEFTAPGDPSYSSSHFWPSMAHLLRIWFVHRMGLATGLIVNLARFIPSERFSRSHNRYRYITVLLVVHMCYSNQKKSGTVHCYRTPVTLRSGCLIPIICITIS